MFSLSLWETVRAFEKVTAELNYFIPFPLSLVEVVRMEAWLFSFKSLDRLLNSDFPIGIMNTILNLVFQDFTLSSALLSYLPLYEPFALFKVGQSEP